MTIEHEKWLNLTTEAPLEPEMAICDCHHHFFEHTNETYLLDDLLRDIKDHNILKTVFVDCRSRYRQSGPEAMRPVGETEFVQNIAAESTQRGFPGVAAGIVSWADLTLGDAVAPVLEAHITAGKGRFRGIRQTFAWTDEPNARGYHAPQKGLAADANLRKGFPFLKKYGLIFETMLFYHQLPELVDLALAFPDIPIILNHLAGPRTTVASVEKRNEVFRDWQIGIAGLAACPNVLVKLGGFGMGIIGYNWQNRPAPAGSAELAEATAPWLLWCIERFGTDRCMFESNFPVDRRSFSYNVIWNAFKRVTRNFSSGERRALFYDNAVKAYRL